MMPKSFRAIKNKNDLTMQPYAYTRSRQSQQPNRRRVSSQPSKSHHGFIIAVVVFLAVIWCFAFLTIKAHADSAEIKSGLNGYCLDDYGNNTAAGATVDAWGCNGTQAQDWSFNGTLVKHSGTECLSVQNNATIKGSHVVLNTCSNAPGQVWLRDRGGYANPNSDLCLNVPNSQSGVSLIISSCNILSQPSELWTPVTANGTNLSGMSCNRGTEGQRVACYAEKEWTIWQSGSPSHATLLNQYSDGNGYEEWCADFVSYIYREAGHPFTQGERGNNGWDEYNANDIQYMGFTEHSAEGYNPQPGDVAYFDYSGGHVEIVVSGGQTPTFIYGDSGRIDPATGNGEMEANTITSDGNQGQVIYYLSPN
ncbi:MAG: ricin-type beta-trefoil lectin domain protein [Candidatus Saccharimonadales bacterium]